MSQILLICRDWFFLLRAGGVVNLQADLEQLKRKKEAIESEPDPVAEVIAQLNMVEEDKNKLQKYKSEKKTYAEKLYSMVRT